MAPIISRKSDAARMDEKELHQHVLGELTKLNDADTQKQAARQLRVILATMSPMHLPTFLSAVADAGVGRSGATQRGFARKEAAAVLGYAAEVHKESMLPLVPKAMGSLLRRFKDTEAGIAEACAESAGKLAKLCATSDGNNDGVVWRPLLEALHDSNGTVQRAALLCIVSASRGASEGGVSAVSVAHAALPRLLKHFKQPAFQARGALLDAIGELFTTAGDTSSKDDVGAAVAAAEVSMASQDHQLRRKAAEMLAAIAASAPSSFGVYAVQAWRIISANKYDRMKPVRDAVAQAATAAKPFEGLWKEAQQQQQQQQVQQQQQQYSEYEHEFERDNRQAEEIHNGRNQQATVFIGGDNNEFLPSNPPNETDMSANRIDYEQQLEHMGAQPQSRATSARRARTAMQANVKFFEAADTPLVVQALPLPPEAAPVVAASKTSPLTDNGDKQQREANTGSPETIPTPKSVSNTDSPQVVEQPHTPSSPPTLSNADWADVSIQLRQMAQQQEQLLDMITSLSQGTTRALRSIETRVDAIETSIKTLRMHKPADKLQRQQQDEQQRQLDNRVSTPPQNASSTRANRSSLWSDAAEALRNDDPDTAFRIVLSAKADDLLIRLMARASTQKASRLESATSDNLLRAAARLIDDGTFIESAGEWCQAIATAEISGSYHPDQISPEMAAEAADALERYSMRHPTAGGPESKAAARALRLACPVENK